MNKTKLIEKLSKKLSYSKEKCIVISEVLENHFFLSKKNKDKIIQELILKLQINHKEADRIYETALDMIEEEIKYKIKHPLKNQKMR